MSTTSAEPTGARVSGSSPGADHNIYGDQMAFDVERARRDTPGASRVAHLNNAGAALPPDET